MATNAPIPSIKIAANSETGSTPKAKATVLLVEDDNYVSASIWTLLKYSNFDVAVADSGADGFRLAQSLSPDIVLLDVNLPDMDGLEICRRLKADPATSDIPVVFFSGHGQFAHKALDLGAEAFLTKPNEIVRLADTLTQILTSRATTQIPEGAA
ncbi:MAG TPA: response regulator [Verrucomicrobiae bacterium]|jgi:DNA-binding response OmpR family regulator|nr:response regulator [Verrucomicrobiae bacterium]